MARSEHQAESPTCIGGMAAAAKTLWRQDDKRQAAKAADDGSVWKKAECGGAAWRREMG
jgi:hypothetical protein